MDIIYTLHFFPITRLMRKHSCFLRGLNSVITTLNFNQTPQIMFLTYPAIRKNWFDKIPRGARSHHNFQPSVYYECFLKQILKYNCFVISFSYLKAQNDIFIQYKLHDHSYSARSKDKM